MKKIMSRLAVAAIGASIIAAGATAATPESGTIGPAAKKAKWSGSVASGVSYYAWRSDPSAPCTSGDTCDSFTLNVAQDGDVSIKVFLQNASASGGNGGASIRVTLPDGSHSHIQGESGPKTALQMKLKAAKAGEYTVDFSPSYLNGGDYTAEADWFPTGQMDQPAAPAPEPTAGATPAPQPSPGTPPAPGTAPQAFTLTAKAGKVSARKAKKGKTISVSVTTSRAVEEVSATIKKGSKVMGTGKVAPFSGKGKVKLKLSKALKKGNYVIAVIGRDKGAQASKNIRVRVKK